MKTPLEHLLGCRVTKAFASHDYHQLFFDSGATLNVYNRFALIGVENIDELFGRFVLSAIDSPEPVCLSFSDSLRLDVNMRDEAWDCPEALELNGPGQTQLSGEEKIRQDRPMPCGQ